MLTKTKIAMAAGLLATLVFSESSLAQQAIFLPPSYASSQQQLSNSPVEHISRVKRRARDTWLDSEIPYGQW
jgi:hypothetical protein